MLRYGTHPPGEWHGTLKPSLGEEAGVRPKLTGKEDGISEDECIEEDQILDDW